MTGRSAVRLARVLREHEVGGSNPLAPIFYLLRIHQRTLQEGRSGVWLACSDRIGKVSGSTLFARIIFMGQ